MFDNKISHQRNKIDAQILQEKYLKISVITIILGMITCVLNEKVSIIPLKWFNNLKHWILLKKFIYK